MLRILGKPTSINVRKVLWTCEELGLAYEAEAWGDGFQPTATPEFRALNPNALVPVVIDGDFVLWESNTICRYLARRERRVDLMPDDAVGAARVEQWMDWQATELNNAWRYAFMALVRHSPRHVDPAQIAAGIETWNRHMTILDARLAATGAFVVGERFTLADVVIGLSVNRWRMCPIERPTLPAVAAYEILLAARSGYRLHGANGTP